MNESVSLKVRVQKLGTALSNMVMPNIPILIAWGVLTMFFIPDGFTPNATFAAMVTPMLVYLIPVMIGYTGGKNIYDHRGGVVGALATFGAILATATSAVGGLNGKANVPMILGAMILGPLGGWVIKKIDQVIQPRVKAGLEMLVNNFSAGLVGFGLALFAVKVVGPVVAWLTDVMGHGVDFLVSAHLIPLANIFIEPAKILFLNNAINQGILSPLGIQQAAEHGKSLLFLLEANPGPGLGILLAFMFFGKGSAKATAPGAVIIQFIGGIHEIYFPYVMMKPALFFAVIAGGVSGTLTNNLLGSGLQAPASPGSIIAITGMASGKAAGGFANVLCVWAGILVAAIVSFLVAAFILRRDKSMTDDTFEAAQAGVASEKATSKGQAVATTNNENADFAGIKHIIFACDAGMGSSAMGASILRNKVKEAGLAASIDTTNVAIANLQAGADTIVVTQHELAARAAGMAPGAVRYEVSNFLSSPVYDEIIDKLTGEAPSAEAAPAVVGSSTDFHKEIDLNTIDEVVFAHDAAHMGSATMGKATMNEIFKVQEIKIPVSEVEFVGLASFNAPNIMIVTTKDFTAKAEEVAPNAQHLSVDSLITAPEFTEMVGRLKN
ncbi:PTS mannitol transporter subunit IICBA [Lactococcus termiticola]|uniref:PTS system mannitol-specific EIICB component n=1 Tax=Lactococcus termiticola TaxID=2169526 RepID=A0A2R5HKW6_9LACT|nr:PTS mannitol transporter subunit IICBA [Lactococcus termiticola]GBG97331.1 mannitol-specific PTS system IIBC component [Lactococcus termiticola]